LCFDGDRAGVAASIRIAFKALPALKPGKSLQFCYLADGFDPEDLINEKGANVMQSSLNAASPLADVLWQHLLNPYEKKNIDRERWLPEDKAALKKDIFDTTNSIKNEDIRSSYRQMFLEKFSEIRYRTKQLRHALKNTLIVPRHRPQRILGQKILLGILLKRPELLANVDELLSGINFMSDDLLKIKDWLLDVYFASGNFLDAPSQKQCHVFLTQIGAEILKIHAPFAFEENVSLTDLLARWKEIWFCTIGYSMIRQDLCCAGNDFKQSFENCKWQRIKAMFANIGQLNEDAG
jgi:DNA primase